MERTFSLRLPIDAEATHGLTFTDSPKNWVLKSGSVTKFISAKYPQSSSAGVHASNYGEKKSLCGVGVASAETIASGVAEQVAVNVTCVFCQARLVNAGIVDADEDYVSADAGDYGRRQPPDWLPNV